MEIHVPCKFTAERPALTFTHNLLAIDIEDHPLGRTLPRATNGPSIQAGPQNFRSFAAREDAPETLEDFIYHDIPQLSLHVTSFNNATLVALSWPHTLMDVMGQQALLHGWCLVLAGRESEVPPMLGARQDAICAAADMPVEKEEAFILGQKRLRGWAMIKFGLRFAWDLVWNRTVETNTIFLPKSIVVELQTQAQRDISTQDGGEEKPFISEGDVLTAWVARLVASSLPQPRPMTVLHALNARFRLSTLLQASGVYLQNMAVAAFTLLPPEAVTGPLGHIALENRRQLMEQSTEAQVLAVLRELRRESKAGSDPAFVCGEPDALLMPVTNWTRADFFKILDFSPALLRAGDTSQSRSNLPGTMIFHHAQSMRQGPAVRNVIVVLGKDHSDDYWLTGILLPQAWAKIRDDIEMMQ